METYALIGLILGIIVGIIYFIHGDFYAENNFGKFMLIFSRAIMGLLIAAISMFIWAPALVFVGTIAFLAFLAG